MTATGFWLAGADDGDASAETAGWATAASLKVEHRKSDLTVISSFEYERDGLGNPVSIRREDGSCTYYEYDAASQLTKETQRNQQGQNVYAWEWDYDPVGNRTYQTFNGVATYYEYNAANELTREFTAAASTYYQYDHCGNTVSKQETAGATYYHWDHENLLTRVDLPDATHQYFTYDADGKRVTKEDSAGLTRFIYQGPDMLKLLQERDEDDDLVAHYTLGNGLEAMRRGSSSHFYHYDWLGSTHQLTNTAQAVTDAYRYNAWGEVLARTGTTVNPHTYVGRERYYEEREIALHLLGLRYYASGTGTFRTGISLEFALRSTESCGVVREDIAQQRDAYLVCAEPEHSRTYAANTPTTLLDPLGLAPAMRDIVHEAKKLLGKTCFGDWTNLHCIDVWVQAAEAAGYAVKAGMAADYNSTPGNRSHYSWCKSHFLAYNDPSDAFFYRRICNVVTYMGHMLTWDAGCAKPVPGMLVTIDETDSGAFNPHRFGYHSGVVADTQGGRVACVIACSGARGNKVVYGSASQLGFTPSRIFGCGSP